MSIRAGNVIDAVQFFGARHLPVGTPVWLRDHPHLGLGVISAAHGLTRTVVFSRATDEPPCIPSWLPHSRVELADCTVESNCAVSDLMASPAK